MEIQPKRIKITQPENNDDTNEIYEFKCNICNQEFKELKNLNKHIKNIHKEKHLKCSNCSYNTPYPFNMERHIESCTKRKREEDEVEHIAKRAREEELHQSINQSYLIIINEVTD